MTDDDSDNEDLASELYGVPADDEDDGSGSTGGDRDADGTTAGNRGADGRAADSIPNEPAGMGEKTAPGTADERSAPGTTDASGADAAEEGSEPAGGIPFEGPPGAGDAGGSVPADAPISDEEEPPDPESGLFYVKFAEDAAATLHEVNTGQIYTVLQHPEFKRHEIVEATLLAVPPMEVSYTIEELESRRDIPVEHSPEQPTQQVYDVAAEMEQDQAAAIDREGDGEIHILRVKPEWTERTADELHDDEMTYKNVARYGLDRVEIRTDEEEGVVAIRYLP